MLVRRPARDSSLPPSIFQSPQSQQSSPNHIPNPPPIMLQSDEDTASHVHIPIPLPNQPISYFNRANFKRTILIFRFPYSSIPILALPFSTNHHDQYSQYVALMYRQNSDLTNLLKSAQEKSTPECPFECGGGGVESLFGQCPYRPCIFFNSEHCD